MRANRVIANNNNNTKSDQIINHETMESVSESARSSVKPQKKQRTNSFPKLSAAETTGNNGNKLTVPLASAAIHKSNSVPHQLNEFVDRVEHSTMGLVHVLRGSSESAGPTVDDPMMESMNYDNFNDIINELNLEGDTKH